MATISMDVVAALDERSLALAARNLEQRLTRAGTTGAEGITKAIEAEAARTGLGAEAIGAELAKRLVPHGSTAGKGFMSAFTQEMRKGFSEGEFESATGALSSATMLAKATHSGGLMGTAFVGGLTIAAGAAMVGFAAEIGEHFEEVTRQITLHTSATGEQLEQLKALATGAAGTLNSTVTAMGTDISTFFQRLGADLNNATDKMNLAQLTQHVESLRDRFGQLNVDALSASFVQFGVGLGQADGALASIVESARQAGGNVFPELVNNLAQFSTVSKDLDLNLEQTARMMADLARQGVPIQQAMGGMEQASKAFLKVGQGESFSTFIREAAQQMEAFDRAGNKTARDQLAMDVFGTRKWSDAKRAAEEYLAVLRAGPDAFKGNSAQLANTLKESENLHNKWIQIQNIVKRALAPQGKSLVEEVGEKMDKLSNWLRAHQDDLRKFFETAQEVIEKVIKALGEVMAWLGRHPQAIKEVAIAFATWESVKGISAVLSSLSTVITRLKTIKAEAPLAAAELDAVNSGGKGGKGGKSGSRLGRGLNAGVNSLPLIGTGIAATQGLGNDDLINRQAQSHDWWHLLFGNSSEWFGDDPPKKPPQPPTPPPAPNLPPPMPPGTSWYTQTYGQGAAPGAPAAPGPGDAPDTDILGRFNKDKKGPKGPRLPQAPELPYGPGYGAPPQPGESASHYSDRQRILEVEHQIEEDRARVQQLEQANNATAEDIQQAKNKLAHDEADVQQARLRMHEEEQNELKKYLGGLKEHTGQLEQIGAKIDDDFGISKGLSGIAENLTKFLANLVAAPVYGSLMGTMAAAGGVPSGAGGLIGMGAVSGMFGQQYTPQYQALMQAMGGGKGGHGGIGAAGLGAGAGAGSGLEALLGGARQPYGLPKGSDVRQGAPGFPDWVYQIGQQFGLKASTYSGHQESNRPDIGAAPNPQGLNRGIDWYGSQASMDAFASFLQQSGLAEQVIHYDPTTGTKYGYPFNVDYGGDYPGHGDHVHTRFSQSIPVGLGGAGGDVSPALLGKAGMGLGIGPGAVDLKSYIISQGQRLGLSPTEIGMALAVQQHEGKGPTGNYSMGFGPEAKAAGMNFDASPYAAVDQYFRQYTNRRTAGLNPNDPNSVGRYIWHSVHNAADPNYLQGLMGSYPGPVGEMPGAPGFATGGESSDTALARLTPGEHVLTTTDVAAMGGQSGVYNFRQSLHKGSNKTGGTGGPAGMGTGGLLGFWGGGEVPDAPPPAPPQPTPPPPPTPPPMDPSLTPKQLMDTANRPRQLPYIKPGEQGPAGPKEPPKPKEPAGSSEPKDPNAHVPGGLPGPPPPQAPGGPQPGPTMIGGVAPPKGSGPGFQFGGGSIGGAEGAAASAANMFAPGAGVAAQIGMQELNRGISAAGQAGGALFSGFLQTVLPAGGSELAQNSWLTKWAGGIVGAKPQLPNVAGTKSASSGLTPEQMAESGGGAPPGAAAGPPGGNTHNGSIVHIENFNAGDRGDASVANEIARHAGATNSLTGSR